MRRGREWLRKERRLGKERLQRRKRLGREQEERAKGDRLWMISLQEMEDERRRKQMEWEERRGKGEA